MGNLKQKLKENKKKKKKKTSSEIFQKEANKEQNIEKIKPNEKKKRKREKGNNFDTGEIAQISEAKNIKVEGKKIKNKSHKEKRKRDEENGSLVGKSDKLGNKDEGGLDEQIGKSKKSKKKKKEHDTSWESEKLLEKREEAVKDGVHYISSGVEDSSKGMKKWILKYHQSRPGLKVLQQRIDDFINAHEEKLELERKEREAEAAKDGWTVVVHHKGRKKTTDSENGVTVGSVAPAVAESMLTTKKTNEVKLDFYRFQKREAQRNEILALQDKFEQDRKRIQQLRAARKFRPY